MRRILTATSFDSFFRHGEKLTRKNTCPQRATRIVEVSGAENVVSEETSTRSVFGSFFLQRRQTASVNEKLRATTTVQNGGSRTSIVAGHRTTGIQGTRSSVVLRCVFRGLFQLRDGTHSVSTEYRFDESHSRIPYLPPTQWLRLFVLTSSDVEKTLFSLFPSRWRR